MAGLDKLPNATVATTSGAPSASAPFTSTPSTSNTVSNDSATSTVGLVSTTAKGKKWYYILMLII